MAMEQLKNFTTTKPRKIKKKYFVGTFFEGDYMTRLSFIMRGVLRQPYGSIGAG